MVAITAARDVFKFTPQGGEDAPILRGISLAVEEGEFVCVMGPSGSGKSTLLHTLSGLDRPSAGRVELGGRDLAKLTERQRTLQRRDTVGFVFQFFNLLPNLSVIENVRLPLAIAGKNAKGASDAPEALLERFGLGHRLDARVHELSGGEMQRVSIARALAGGQPLLLCDEPTGNLSQKAGLEVMQLLRRVCNEDRRSVLLVTHNPRDAAFADRVLFLVDGELARDVELRGPDIPVESIHEALAGLSI